MKTFDQTLNVSGGLKFEIENNTNLSNDEFQQKLKEGSFIIGLETGVICDTNDNFKVVGIFYIIGNELEYIFY